MTTSGPPVTITLDDGSMALLRFLAIQLKEDAAWGLVEELRAALTGRLIIQALDALNRQELDLAKEKDK